MCRSCHLQDRTGEECVCVFRNNVCVRGQSLAFTATVTPSVLWVFRGSRQRLGLRHTYTEDEGESRGLELCNL